MSGAARRFSTPRVTTLTFGAKATATIVDCMDITHWEPFHQPTGKSLRPASQKLRLPITVTARRVDGHWLIEGGGVDAGRTSC